MARKHKLSKQNLINKSLKALSNQTPLIFIIFVIIVLVLSQFDVKSYLVDEKDVTLCFTPQQQCENLIVHNINQANESILMQSYSFTSKPILNALVFAQQRNVDVQIIFDKDQLNKNYSIIPTLKANNIPIYIDQIKGLAHNKIIIIDQQKVITGSYNHTYSAQHRNAENVIIFNARNTVNLKNSIIEAYTENWISRRNDSLKLAN